MTQRFFNSKLEAFRLMRYGASLAKSDAAPLIAGIVMIGLFGLIIWLEFKDNAKEWWIRKQESRKESERKKDRIEPWF